MTIKPFKIEAKPEGEHMAVIVTVKHSNGRTQIKGASEYTLAGIVAESMQILDFLAKDGTIIAE